MTMGKSGLLAAGVAAACLAVSGCSSTSSEDSAGKKFANLIFYGGTTVPASGAGLVAAVPCPAVTIASGGAAINSYAGGREAGPEALRSQLSITDVARECTGRPDGSIIVKVGVEGRALVGPGGSAGRFEAPVGFAIKRHERVLASATRRAAVALSPGETQGTFLVVEDGLVVPPNTDDFDIEVGLGGSGAERPARRARR
jgi:hypothetical protein